MRNAEAKTLSDALRRTAHALDRRTIESHWSRAALRAAVRSGAVTRLLPGLYAATEHSESALTRSQAATAWVGPGSIAVGAAAASAWELCDPPQSVTVTAPRGMSRGVPRWLTLTRPSEPLPSADWYGCPVALPPWAVVTAYGHLPRDRADEMVYLAVRRGLATPKEIASAVDKLGSVRGRRALEATLRAAAQGSESHLETVGLRTVFAHKDFSRFVRQHRVHVDGVNYRLDMYDPLTRTAVELDGAAAHAGDHQRARDTRRDARLTSIGIATLRLTYRDIVGDPAWCRTMVRRTLAQRDSGREGPNASRHQRHI